MSALQPDFDKGGGVVTAVAQDAETKEVLMVAFMNREAWELTQSTGIVHYFSRSRNRIWKKGESSGHIQTVREIRLDCDADSAVILVTQQGAACHDGYRSCFYRSVTKNGDSVNQDRLVDPETVYK